MSKMKKGVRLDHISKIYQDPKTGKDFYAVKDTSLTIEPGSFVTLLGPSGCGKTTTLRMIAGLETPTSGRITIGDQVVFDSEAGINIPANKRKVGFLFQNYALWPNMTVYQNISVGLTNVKEALPKIDLEALKAAGSPDKAAVKAALPGLTYTGVSGDIAFDEVGDAIRDTAYIKTADNAAGAWTLETVQTAK